MLDKENKIEPFSGLSFWSFVLRASVVIVLAVAALTAGGIAFVIANKDKPAPKVTISKPDKSSDVGYSFGDSWNEIEAPKSVGNIFTRCDPLRDGERMYVTSDNHITFQSDAKCKKA